MLGIVGRVALAVVEDHFAKIEGRNAFQAGDVDAELIRVRAAFVVRVDAADTAEMMLSGARVEPVGGEFVLPARDPQAIAFAVTAIAPRIRQMLQVQRRADERP